MVSNMELVRSFLQGLAIFFCHWLSQVFVTDQGVTEQGAYLWFL
jgi:hypothetical protein